MRLIINDRPKRGKHLESEGRQNEKAIQKVKDVIHSVEFADGVHANV
jgi:hypothetical protein